ncbi:putative oxidoreductase C-terminal domain-containing protein [Gemmata sp.]|uniref:putative oxidoreductase C-terminal domain-containing protein n=1 Tax=Gemmata sp. TaxID=1914242 RepID=UPI003F720078
MKPIRLMTLAPGHFHAALVQKRMVPGVTARNYVYAPLDADTVAYLERLAAFNARAENPTAWEVDLRASDGWRERFEREQPGNVVFLSGRNRPKIDLMRLAVRNNLHVIADKPWVIEYADFPKVEELYRETDLRDVLVWDVMTERHEVTNQLVREFIRDGYIFGKWQAGTASQPALNLESRHFLRKTVASRPLVRPWWWFDPKVAGESLADVGTHLADLALWFVSPDRMINYRSDVHHLAAEAWPLLLSEDEFCALTGLPRYPEALAARVVNEQLYYAGNNTVTLALAGVHVKLATTWEFEAPAGGADTHAVTALGTHAKIEVRHDPTGVPEVYLAATNPADHAELFRRLAAKCELMRGRLPGLAATDRGTEVKLEIPDRLRTTHEDHFATVMDEFVRYFHNPRAVPAWERPNTLGKYYITTKAIEMARNKPPA